MSLLAGRVGLVTGAGSGFGRAISLEMAREGADVVLNDINAEAAAAVAREVLKLGRTPMTVVADVASTEAVEAMVGMAVERFGRVDLLVNNAGHGEPGDVPIEAMNDERWERMLGVHLGGTMRVTRGIVPVMKKQGRGRIVNISSIAGMVGEASFSHYCAAKAGILGFTKAMARELSPWKINVNAVAPGVCGTAYTANFGPGKVPEIIGAIPWGRMGEAQEIAWLVIFLLSDRADFITGQVISPNGGEVIVGI